MELYTAIGLVIFLLIGIGFVRYLIKLNRRARKEQSEIDPKKLRKWGNECETLLRMFRLTPDDPVARRLSLICSPFQPRKYFELIFFPVLPVIFKTTLLRISLRYVV